MKKLFVVLAVAVLGLVSCKKDYTCECVGSSNGVKVEGSATSVTINDTKANATDQCDKGDVSVNGMSIDCEIK